MSGEVAQQMLDEALGLLGEVLTHNGHDDGRVRVCVFCGTDREDHNPDCLIRRIAAFLGADEHT